MGVRRIVDRPDIFADMLSKASIVYSAWDWLVGMSRTMTDFSYVAYVADLAVHENYQQQGIRRELLVKTRQELGPEC